MTSESNISFGFKIYPSSLEVFFEFIETQFMYITLFGPMSAIHFCP